MSFVTDLLFGKSGTHDGGYGAASAEQIAYLTDQLKESYKKYITPEADRWIANRGSMDPLRAGMLEDMYNPKTAEESAAATKATKDKSAALVRKTAVDYQAATDAYNGFDTTGWGKTNPKPVPAANESNEAYTRRVNTWTTARKAALAPITKSIATTKAASESAVAASKVPVFDKNTAGLGQTIAAPTLKAGDNWQTVGRKYDKIMTAANMLGIGRGQASAASEAGRAMAKRGINNSSLSGTQQQALANRANEQRVMAQANTYDARLNQEGRAREEVNNNAWKTTGWNDQQAANKKKDFWDQAQWLYTDGQYQINPLAAQAPGAALAGQYGQLGQNISTANQNNRNANMSFALAGAKLGMMGL